MSVKNSSDIRCRWHYFRTVGRPRGSPRQSILLFARQRFFPPPPLPLFSFSSFYFRGDDKRADHNLAATRWRITLNKPPVLFSLQLLHDIIFSTRNERCESVLYDIKYLSRERERKEKVAWVRVESGRKTMAKFNSRSRRCVVSSSLSSSKIVLP